MSSDQTIGKTEVMEQTKLINLGSKKKLNLDDINIRIEKEFCYETAMELTDEKLLDKYKECPSVMNSIIKLDNLLSKYVDEEVKNKIIQEYTLELIPAGTKGVIRGNKFNKITENRINSFVELDKDKFDVSFEKECKKHMTHEKPDWYILEKSTGKTIIGMNQLDLWGGGHQINRGSKYIINNQHNSENSKLLCVVCNKIQFKSNKNKTFNFFKVGFENNTLCYLNNLQNIIYSYFNLK
tara:strand:- start:221 stop:937 length:717 start_codon:yes stop_codon:yes gene_type:complete